MAGEESSLEVSTAGSRRRSRGRSRSWAWIVGAIALLAPAPGRAPGRAAEGGEPAQTTSGEATKASEGKPTGKEATDTKEVSTGGTEETKALESPAGSESTPDAEQQLRYGVPTDMDALEKHFAVIIGATILNQYQIRNDGTEDTPVFQLQEGSTEADLFLEGSYRYRWAWLDRTAYATGDPDARRALRAAQRSASSLRAQYDAVSLEVGKLRIEREALRKEIEERSARSRGNREEGKSPQEKEKAAKEAEEGAAQEREMSRIDKTLPGRETLSRDLLTSLTRVEEDAVQLRARMATSRDAQVREQLDHAAFRAQAFPDWSDFCHETAKAFVPDDWTLRVGYVFSPDTGENVVSVVGASNLYGEVGLGWDILRWSLRGSTGTRAPIRGSASLEGDALLYTDKKNVEVHERAIVGLALSIGVPMNFLGGDKDDAAVLAGEEPSAPPVAEFLARLGWAYADVPDFVAGDSREIEARHDFPRYEGASGFGLDVELNVPISPSLGYVMFRGSMNAGFEPSLWFISIGYTIPLSGLAKALSAK